jgi:selenocysteine-specific elongation factor
VDLAPDVAESAAAAVLAAVGTAGIRVGPLRATTTTAIRRLVTLRREAAVIAADQVIDRLVADGRLSRDGDAIRPPGLAVSAAADPALAAAMDRLEAALDVPAPPPLSEAARAAGCPPDGVRALERAERIAILEPDLAYAMAIYRDLSARAVTMAAREPLTPAAYRDATGTSRKYVMAILEDLDRRAVLRRTPAGHVPGPKAPRATSSQP